MYGLRLNPESDGGKFAMVMQNVLSFEGNYVFCFKMIQDLSNFVILQPKAHICFRFPKSLSYLVPSEPVVISLGCRASIFEPNFSLVQSLIKF